MQTVDQEKVATPANWFPGIPVLVPALTIYQQLKERAQNSQGLSCVDWFLFFKLDTNMNTKAVEGETEALEAAEETKESLKGK